MKFLDRSSEMKKLDEIITTGDGGLAVIYGRHLILGEVKWSRKPYKADEIQQMARQILVKGVPPLPKPYSSLQILRAIFIPETVQKISKIPEGVFVITGDDLVMPEV